MHLLCITVSRRNIKLCIDVEMRKKLNKSFDIIFQILRLNHADITGLELHIGRNVEFDRTGILKVVFRGHTFTAYQRSPKWILGTVATFAI